ncbi:MAG: metallophosphoesterase [Flavitalea sp.]
MTISAAIRRHFLFIILLAFSWPLLSQVTRGPYLQMGGKTTISIRWRTSSASNSKIELGTSYGAYPITFSNSSSLTEHIVTATGLNPDTKYYYRIGTSATMQPSDPDQFFTTLPPDTTTRKLRFAAFGDCGRNDNSFQSRTLAQYRSYLTANSIEAPDAWLLLGDNAYNSGTDAQYTTGFFNAYGSSILKNHKLYPVPGNHDYGNNAANQASHLVPYYDIFNLPTNGEIGGTPSGTEAYYSYNIGNIHFMALDAYGEETGHTRIYDTTSPQVTWVKNDLAANSKKWTIAYWHHPPYTKGSHDSDTEEDLVSIRENFIRILERNGVDLVICGHSHDYERSYLLNGYYKTNPGDPSLNESDFNINAHAASASSGNYSDAASCPYTYASGKIRHGTVYVVAGSSGADGSVQSGYPHNAFPFSQDDGGMFYFEVDDNRLDAKFIRIDGVIADKFTIMKDVNQASDNNVTVGMPVTLRASWPGDYHWNTTASTRSIIITPSTAGTTQYSVTDPLTCLTDAFTVTASSALPVSLLNYNVRMANDKAILSWTSASEVNNKYFTVERSANGQDFILIGKINGSLNSEKENNYSFVDEHPFTGINYYRLSQVDVDGQRKYIGMKTVSYNGGKEFNAKTLSSGNQRLVLQISSPVETVCRVHIYSILGNELKNELVALTPGSTNKEINLTSGAYVWKVANDNGKNITQKIIVQ